MSAKTQKTTDGTPSVTVEVNGTTVVVPLKDVTELVGLLLAARKDGYTAVREGKTAERAEAKAARDAKKAERVAAATARKEARRAKLEAQLAALSA